MKRKLKLKAVQAMIRENKNVEINLLEKKRAAGKDIKLAGGKEEKRQNGSRKKTR